MATKSVINVISFAESRSAWPWADAASLDAALAFGDPLSAEESSLSAGFVGGHAAGLTGDGLNRNDTPGTTIAIRKYATPTQMKGRKWLPPMSAWPMRSTGP